MVSRLDPGELPPRDFWEGIASDLTTRGALGAALATLYAVAVLSWWWWRNHRAHRITARISVRILVAGSRGKSSTVRLLHAALTAHGYRVFAKCTGTAAAQISPNGEEQPTIRRGQISILEMQDALFDADRLGANVYVMENMAVSPHLIAEVSEDIVRPNVAVITNADLDHLEEEGTTREEVMASLANTIGPADLVVTAERTEGALARLAFLARSKGEAVIHVDRLPQETFWVPHAHPDNVAVALAVTRALKLDDTASMAGMRAASHEIGDHPVHDLDIGALHLRFIDLGAVNDPRNAAASMARLAGRVIPGAPVLAMLIGRSDRPMRALEFAALLPPSVVDGVLLHGGPVYEARTELIRSGWAASDIAILHFGAWGTRLFAWELNRFLRGSHLDGDSATIFMLENIHDPIADRIHRSFDRRDNA